MSNPLTTSKGPITIRPAVTYDVLLMAKTIEATRE